MKHICQICGYTTNRIFNLKQHLNKKNPCVKKQDNVSNTSENQEEKSEISLQENSESSNAKAIKKYYECQICFKLFNNRQARFQHNKNVKCKPTEAAVQKKKFSDQSTQTEASVINTEIEIIKEEVKSKQEEVILQKLKLKLLSLQNESVENEKLISTGTIPMKKQTSKNQFTPSQKKTIIFNQDYKCKICDILLPTDFEIDHIISRADGGTNDLSNGQALCKVCHERKTYQENTERQSFKKIMSLN